MLSGPLHYADAGPTYASRGIQGLPIEAIHETWPRERQSDSNILSIEEYLLASGRKALGMGSKPATTHPSRKARLAVKAREHQELQAFPSKPLSKLLVERKTALLIMLNQFESSLPSSIPASLAAQIDRMMRINTWDENQPIPDMQSMLGLIRSVAFLEPTKPPSIGCTATGLLSSAYRQNAVLLYMEHRPDDQVRWSLSHRILEGPKVTAGDTDITRLLETLPQFALKMFDGQAA